MTRRSALVAVLLLAAPAAADPKPAAGWKAGVAKAVITPKQPMWLAGYGGRNRPSESTLHDVWIKALALEDAAGYRVALLTSDLCGMPKWMYDRVCAALKESHGLGREQVRLTNSHNHCAPAVRGELEDYYPLDDEQRKRVSDYSDWLEREIVATLRKALDDLKPAAVSAGEGACGFAVNRRNNKEADIPAVLARGEKLKGPVDHSVPVLAVTGADDKLMAVVFGYACHNTTLSFYQWCGDYAGFAQIALEKAHPGAQAMFVTGCGGDQNPLPRRTVELCEKYGNELAAAVEKVLAGKPRPLAPTLRAAFTFAPLAFERNPTREELAVQLKGPPGIRQRWAKRLLARLDAGDKLETEYPFAVQAWRLGDQTWLALGGETLVHYSLRFKKQYGPGIWVTSYAHDLTAYIPSEANLREGGYESSNLYEYQLPAERWARDVEDRVSDAVDKVMKQVTR